MSIDDSSCPPAGPSGLVDQRSSCCGESRKLIAASSCMSWPFVVEESVGVSWNRATVLRAARPARGRSARTRVSGDSTILPSKLLEVGRSASTVADVEEILVVLEIAAEIAPPSIWSSSARSKRENPMSIGTSRPSSRRQAAAADEAPPSPRKLTWKSGLKLGSLRTWRHSTSFSNGSSWCARAPAVRFADTFDETRGRSDCQPSRVRSTSVLVKKPISPSSSTWLRPATGDPTMMSSSPVKR